MGYISKLDTKFITFMNRKYGTSFRCFETYSEWLYKAKNYDKNHYYSQLENDLWEYSDFQTGSLRSKERNKLKGRV